VCSVLVSSGETVAQAVLDKSVTNKNRLFIALKKSRKFQQRAMPRKSTNRITKVKEIKLLASGLRQEIIDTIEARGGEASAGELAEELGRPEDGLYYHLRLLAKGGLLEEIAGVNAKRYRIRQRGRAEERFELEYRPREAANVAAVSRVVDSMLRIAGRDFGRAIKNKATRVEGPRRELWAARSKGWVNERELAQINALLIKLTGLLHRVKQPGRERLITLCFVLAPTEAKPRRRRA
jgi:hypothetical protein